MNIPQVLLDKKLITFKSKQVTDNSLTKDQHKTKQFRAKRLRQEAGLKNGKMHGLYVGSFFYFNNENE